MAQSYFLVTTSTSDVWTGARFVAYEHHFDVACRFRTRSEAQAVADALGAGVVEVAR